LDGVDVWWHFDWQLGIGVLGGFGEETDKFFFIDKHVTVVFVLDDQECISLDDLALVLKSDRAVTLECLLLSNELSSLVRADEERGVSFVGEDGLVGESLGVLHENVTLFSSIEVVELMAVKDTEFGSMCARYEGLLHFPGYWAHVTILR
jgi:hypothetical protein